MTHSNKSLHAQKGRTGSAQIPFSMIEQDPELVDPDIFPLLQILNHNNHLKTRSSCSGHGDCPYLMFDLTDTQFFQFYQHFLGHLLEKELGFTRTHSILTPNRLMIGRIGNLIVEITTLDMFNFKNRVGPPISSLRWFASNMNNCEVNLLDEFVKEVLDLIYVVLQVEVDPRIFKNLTIRGKNW
jgi:hypothetical protein